MQSHPSWVCGLKPGTAVDQEIPIEVTPFVGVWIETEVSRYYLRFKTSHPSWVCGLKQTSVVFLAAALESHPSWVCGLKLMERDRR